MAKKSAKAEKPVSVFFARDSKKKLSIDEAHRILVQYKITPSMLGTQRLIREGKLQVAWRGNVGERSKGYITTEAAVYNCIVLHIPAIEVIWAQLEEAQLQLAQIAASDAPETPQEPQAVQKYGEQLAKEIDADKVALTSGKEKPKRDRSKSKSQQDEVKATLPPDAYELGEKYLALVGSSNKVFTYLGQEENSELHLIEWDDLERETAAKSELDKWLSDAAAAAQ